MSGVSPTQWYLFQNRESFVVWFVRKQPLDFGNYRKQFFRYRQAFIHQFDSHTVQPPKADYEFFSIVRHGEILRSWKFRRNWREVKSFRGRNTPIPWNISLSPNQRFIPRNGVFLATLEVRKGVTSCTSGLRRNATTPGKIRDRTASGAARPIDRRRPGGDSRQGVVGSLPPGHFPPADSAVLTAGTDWIRRSHRSSQSLGSTSGRRHPYDRRQANSA